MAEICRQFQSALHERSRQRASAMDHAGSSAAASKTIAPEIQRPSPRHAQHLNRGLTKCMPGSFQPADDYLYFVALEMSTGLEARWPRRLEARTTGEETKSN